MVDTDDGDFVEVCTSKSYILSRLRSAFAKFTNVRDRNEPCEIHGEKCKRSRV